ncbi:MAG: hypothetical protein JNK35_10835 [Phycisphaerae bacterium]|nr:hypothetical protein [Phycisphaerae bacterium]
MTATWAIVLDAYRELNARKLFWITLVLSVVVVAAMASVGISDKGFTLLWFEFPFPIFNASVLDRADFYKLVFVGLGFNIWLTWAATILALISTASIVPDFVSSGSIELALSKPVSRSRLFLTKYLTGVLFVGLQVGLFSLLSFLVIGVRGSSWEFGLFWSVPIILVFFSYLYAVSTLVGLLTRSPITALLVTGVVWFVVFGIHFTETVWLLRSTTINQLAIPLHENEIASRKSQLDAARAALERDAPSSPASGQATPPAQPSLPPATSASTTPPATPPVGDETPAPWATMDALLDVQQQRRDVVARLDAEIASYERSLTQIKDELDTQRRYHAIVFALKTILPKTTETTDLLQRRLFTGDELDRVRERAEAEGRSRGRNFGTRAGAVRVSDRIIEKEIQDTLRSRSAQWVILTSLGFEVAVLGAACIIFARKDF